MNGTKLKIPKKTLEQRLNIMVDKLGSKDKAFIDFFRHFQRSMMLSIDFNDFRKRMTKKYLESNAMKKFRETKPVPLGPNGKLIPENNPLAPKPTAFNQLAKVVSSVLPNELKNKNKQQPQQPQQPQQQPQLVSGGYQKRKNKKKN